jgi:hypothetical protein
MRACRLVRRLGRGRGSSWGLWDGGLVGEAPADAGGGLIAKAARTLRVRQRQFEELGFVFEPGARLARDARGRAGMGARIALAFPTKRE